MKQALSIFILFLLISCQSKVSTADLQKLNGYWEIQQVRLPNGEKKDYKVNETVDYFEVKNNKGFRQKVMPQFNGKFQTNGIKETIEIDPKNNPVVIHYQTPYGKWDEEIVEIKDSTLVLKNNQKITYTYKKFKPFSLK